MSNPSTDDGSLHGSFRNKKFMAKNFEEEDVEDSCYAKINHRQ